MQRHFLHALLHPTFYAFQKTSQLAKNLGTKGACYYQGKNKEERRQTKLMKMLADFLTSTQMHWVKVRRGLVIASFS